MRQPALNGLGLGLAVCAALAGCATTWVGTELVAGRPPFDERSTEEAVPLPGVSETLHVVVYLNGLPRAQTAAQPIQSGGLGSSRDNTPFGQITPGTPGPPPPPPEAVVDCTVNQRGRERVYRAAVRYGRKWKWATGVSFLLEGGLGALLLGSHKKLSYDIEGGYFALDALGSLLLFFAPERSIYETSERESATAVRDDCPEGLLLDLGGRAVPVDASGHLNDLGLVLLEQSVTTTQLPIGVHVGDFGGYLAVSGAERCEFARRRSLPGVPELCRQAAGYPRGVLVVDIEVPLGALTAVPGS